MTSRHAVLLVPDLDAARDSLWEDEQPVAWHVDALLVAIARSAMAHRWRILMPADDRFAPLVADVVAEYAAPREAEPSAQAAEEQARSTRPMGFVRLTGHAGKHSRRSASAAKPAGLHFNPHVALGAVDEEPLTLDDSAVKSMLRGVILVGSGPRLRQVQNLSQLRQLPFHHLLAGASPRRNPPNPPVGSDIVADLTREMDALRGQLNLVRFRTSESANRNMAAKEVEPAEPPADFWRYPAYPLIADLLLSRMVDRS
ncbi:MAG: hypothetical protein ACK5QX_06350 [bacterium]|jgi:hypothetical protein